MTSEHRRIKKWLAKRLRDCRKKQTFNTIKDAGVRAADAYLNNRIVLKTYECGLCGKYHLTSREQ